MKIKLFFAIIQAMYEKTFQNLLGSKTKIYLLRYIFCNQPPFKIKDIESFLKSQAGNKRLLKKEIKNLIDIGLLKKRGKNLFLKEDFFLFEELKNLSLKYSPALFEEIKKILKPITGISFLALGGVFKQDFDFFDKERVDIVLVVRGINLALEKKLSSKIKKIEQLVGCEINYMLLTKKEFDYRLSMFDKLLENWLNQEPIVLIKREKRKSI